MPSPTTIPINVSSRVLRHISRGIYRTPAGALKELVSNAHDAGARLVTINSGYPTFNRIVVTDDGDGMTSEEFKDFVQNIGFSNKIAGETLTFRDGKIKRTMIGHYGIGLLAVGQLAARMRITSKTMGQMVGFTAELDFNQFERFRVGAGAFGLPLVLESLPAEVELSEQILPRPASLDQQTQPVW